MQPTSSLKRRTASGVIQRARAAVILILSITCFTFARNIGFRNLFAGFFPPIVGIVLGLVLGAAISMALIRYLPRVVALLADLALFFVAIGLADNASSTGVIFLWIASFMGLVVGVPIAISREFRKEETTVEQRRGVLSAQSKDEDRLISWWREGRMEFENSIATPADLQALLAALNGKKRARFSAFNKGSRIDVFGGPKQGYVFFYSEDATLPLEEQNWIQLLDDPSAKAILVDSNGQRRKAHKKSNNTARTYPGYKPVVFGQDELNSIQAVAEVVDRFATGAPVRPEKKWVEGDQAYYARPLVFPKETNTDTVTPINNG
ncbi:hypothetical protein [Glutamicibacter sp. JC586]|uniref:hypothetical protein n=1 Tax=Glutamicibacter sp. JC586 TaxID=2590552 RepID=UPI00135ADDDF|nr:hypothetical protein [Glutamicibacter sp. JC586]